MRFTVAWHGVDGAPVRAWVRRPGRLRVEDATGRVLAVARDRRRVVRVATAEAATAPSVADTSGAAVSGAGAAPTMALAWPHEVEPETDADGLVRRRPFLAAYDDPMYCDYRWVAMLDPAELADPEPGVEPDAQPLVVEELHATGVCVSTEELGGARPGSGHGLAIEAAGQDMPEELFDAAQPRR